MRLVCIEGVNYHVYDGRKHVCTMQTGSGRPATAAEVEWARLHASAALPVEPTEPEPTEAA
jgi:hypothetical protein